jgi:hypothetical protein
MGRKKKKGAALAATDVKKKRAKSLPSRIYSYGASEPTENLELAKDQMYFAHTFRNSIVEFERERRKRVNEATAKLSPTLAAVEAESEKAAQEYEAAEAAKLARNAAARKKIKDPAANARLKELGKRKSKLYAEVKALRKKTFNSVEWCGLKGQVFVWGKENKFKPEHHLVQKKLEDLELKLAPDLKGLDAQLLAAPNEKELTRLRALKRAVLAKLYATREWGGIQGEIEAWSKKERKRLDKASGFTSGSWGTKGAVNEAAKSMRKGAPPDFRRFDGSGKLTSQIQGGLTVAEAMSNTDKRLWIEVTPEVRRISRASGDKVFRKGVFIAGLRHSKKLGDAILHLRIESTKVGKKAPIYCSIPFFYHRELPTDAEIKYVYILRRRLATHDQWSVQFVMSRASGWAKPDRATTGSVGIDLGWRLLEDGTLRVASWQGSDGASGTLVLPLQPQTSHSKKLEKERNEERLAGDGEPVALNTPVRERSWVNGMRKTEDIQSIRDDLLNKARAPLVEWIKSRGKDLPKEFSDRITSKKYAEKAKAKGTKPPTTLAHWHSPARFASLVLWWRNNRFAGDEEAFAALEAWRQRDKHLYEYQSNLRDRLQGQRMSIYRNAVAMLRRRYAVAKIEGRKPEEKDSERPMDLRPFHELPGPTAPAGAVGEKGSPAKEHVRDACLSSFRELLAESMTVETLPAPGTTYKCNRCGSAEDWDQAVLMHTCSQCNETWDQDSNAAINILNGTSASTAVAVEV